MEEDRQALLASVGAAMRNVQRATDAVDEAVAEKFGVNRTDLRHLDLLFDGPLTAGALAEASGLSPAAMTTLIDRLEKKGYVRRVRDAGDRRRVFVELTDTARNLAWQLYGPLVEAGTSRLARYTDAELVFIRDYLRGERELSEAQHQRIREQRLG